MWLGLELPAAVLIKHGETVKPLCARVMAAEHDYLDLI